MNSDRREFIKTFVLGIVSTGPVFSLLSCDTDKQTKKPDKTEQRDKTNDFSEGIELRKGYMVMEPEVQKTLVAMAAVILPGVKNIDLHRIFMEKMSEDHGEAGFFDAGLWNVNTVSNMQTGKPFYKIEDKEERDNVLKLVRKTNRQFFNRFRNEIIRTYYSHPESWKKLSYSGPPQPEGFMDYDKAPRHS